MSPLVQQPGEAIEKAAKEFKQDSAKLIAVQRR